MKRMKRFHGYEEFNKYLLPDFLFVFYKKWPRKMMRIFSYYEKKYLIMKNDA